MPAGAPQQLSILDMCGAALGKLAAFAGRQLERGAAETRDPR
jgi:hypothetical protein